MLKAKLLTYFVAMLTFAGLFYQCTEDHHSRYEDPPWLGGTNIETLEKEGNYNSFLALMDKADYRTSIENQMFTLFVPNDSSFNIYMQSIGKSSIDELSVREAEELFGLHILVNPRSREQLLYEYSGDWGELETPEGEYGTLFHRKSTYSAPIDYYQEVNYHKTFAGQTLKLYRLNTLVPVWSSEYFEDYFGSAEADYRFMYPESNWDNEIQLNWHDAMVTEAEVRTSTGFIYYVDRVVAPIPTIDKFMYENKDKYGLFYDLAERFADYGSPRQDENDERTYKKSYSDFHNFAEERGPSTAHPANMLNMYTSYVPYNDVLQEYLDNTVLQTYEHIDSVPEMFLVFLLQSHLVDFLNLPSKIDKRFFNHYGDKIDININNDISDAHMCSNGIIYGMNKILEPNAFACVPGPILINKNYSTILHALNNANIFSSLTSDAIDVTLFASTNDELLEYGIRGNKKNNRTVIEKRISDGTWARLNNDDLLEFVQDHYFIGTIDNFDGEGFIRMANDNYLYYSAGKIVSGGNQVAGDVCTVKEKITSEINGNLYYLNNNIKKPLNVAQRIFSDPDLSAFGDLLLKADLIDSVQYDYEEEGLKYPRVRFILELRQWTAFAPTNEAIANAEASGIIPDDVEELKEFINYHFIRNQCVFNDGLFSGSANSHSIDTVIGSDVFYKQIQVSNAPRNLSIQDVSGQTISIDHATANNLVEMGVIHKVNSVLIGNSTK